MKTKPAETIERLIRVRATRRGKPVELRVHYERASHNGCDTYRLFRVEEAESSTSTD
jgi:hypothetical protein